MKNYTFYALMNSLCMICSCSNKNNLQDKHLALKEPNEKSYEKSFNLLQKKNCCALKMRDQKISTAKR